MIIIVVVVVLLYFLLFACVLCAINKAHCFAIRVNLLLILFCAINVMVYNIKYVYTDRITYMQHHCVRRVSAVFSILINNLVLRE